MQKPALHICAKCGFIINHSFKSNIRSQTDQHRSGQCARRQTSCACAALQSPLISRIFSGNPEILESVNFINDAAVFKIAEGVHALIRLFRIDIAREDEFPADYVPCEIIAVIARVASLVPRKFSSRKSRFAVYQRVEFRKESCG